MVCAAKKGGVSATTDPFLLNVNAKLLFLCWNPQNQVYIPCFVRRPNMADRIETVRKMGTCGHHGQTNTTKLAYTVGTYKEKR